MDEIRKVRARIDEIDPEEILLLKDRYENARLLGRIKRARSIEPRDPGREKVILRKGVSRDRTTHVDRPTMEKLLARIETGWCKSVFDVQCKS